MIIAIDDFIKDENLLKEIREDQNFFQDPGHYYYWDGWWNSPVNTVKKRLIHYIWGDNCPISKSFEINGFEYWTGIQTADPSLGFKDNLVMHRDKDEAWFRDKGEYVAPVIGTVYYPEQEDFEGGMLEVYTKGQEHAPERIYARPNRLIIFDAGNIFHRVDVVTSGTRKAIAINLWQNEPYSKQIGDFKIEQ